MTFPRASACVVALLLCGACVVPPISTADLEGNALVGETNGRVEIFGCNGAWSSLGSHPLTGAFAVEHGELCTSPESHAPVCRKIHGKEGNVFTLINSDETVERYLLVPIGGEEFCGPQRLSSAQINDVFRGTAVEFGGPGADGAEQWVFDCTGVWSALGGQTAEIVGGYSVADDLLCMEDQLGRWCHAVYRDSRGRVYLSRDVGVPHHSGELVAEVTISPQGRACLSRRSQ